MVWPSDSLVLEYSLSFLIIIMLTLIYLLFIKCVTKIKTLYFNNIVHTFFKSTSYYTVYCGRDTSLFVCLFVCLFVWVFVCFRRTFSLIWRRHNYWWRAANFDLCSALMDIEHRGFFSVPHILWHGASVHNGHLWEPVTFGEMHDFLYFSKRIIKKNNI